MPHFLRKSIGAWSAGTRVEILSRRTDRPESHMLVTEYVEVRVIAGDKPVIEVEESDLVERGAKSSGRSES